VDSRFHGNDRSEGVPCMSNALYVLGALRRYCQSWIGLIINRSPNTPYH